MEKITIQHLFDKYKEAIEVRQMFGSSDKWEIELAEKSMAVKEAIAQEQNIDITMLRELPRSTELGLAAKAAFVELSGFVYRS